MGVDGKPVTDRQIRILREYEHCVLIAPPSRNSKGSDMPEEVEFVLANGYRPLLAIATGFICEKIVKP